MTPQERDSYAWLESSHQRNEQNKTDIKRQSVDKQMSQKVMDFLDLI